MKKILTNAMLLVLIFFFPQLLHSSHYYYHPDIIFTPHNRSASDPQQVHVSLAGKNNVRISWITDDENVPSKVEYGKQPGKYDQVASGINTFYEFFDYSSSKIHHVKIGPLEPATTYYYLCGGNGPEFSFRTPPSKFPIEFAIVGDIGQTEWTLSTLAHIGGADHDVFLLPGDLSYADSNQTLWDSWGRIVEPLASNRPWMVTAGNHEFEQYGFDAFNARWLMPYRESGSTSNLYYSFEVVGAHIVMLGSYAHFGKDSDQYMWLKADLANIDRKRTPWLIVVMHAPWYNTNAAHQLEGESMRNAMEELLYEARVDVIFAGHVHAYERFTRVYNNEADPCGPMFVTIGCGGNHEGLARFLHDNAVLPLSLYRESSFGHGRLRIIDEKRAHWSWYRNNEINAEAGDLVWLESLSSNSACWKIPQQEQSSDGNVNTEL